MKEIARSAISRLKRRVYDLAFNRGRQKIMVSRAADRRSLSGTYAIRERVVVQRRGLAGDSEPTTRRGSGPIDV